MLICHTLNLKSQNHRILSPSWPTYNISLIHVLPHFATPLTLSPVPHPVCWNFQNPFLFLLPADALTSHFIDDSTWYGKNLYRLKWALKISWNVPHWKLTHPPLRNRVEPRVPLALTLSSVWYQINSIAYSSPYCKKQSIFRHYNHTFHNLMLTRWDIYGKWLQEGKRAYSLSLLLWGISSLNDKIGQMFALHKFVSL